MHNSLLLAASQQPLDYNYHQEHFKRQESQVADHEDKDVVNIVKDGVMNEIYQCGECEKATGKNNEWQVTSHCLPPLVVIIDSFIYQMIPHLQAKEGKCQEILLLALSPSAVD